MSLISLSTWSIFWWDESRGNSEPLLLLALFYQSTPSWLKVMGWWGLDFGTLDFWTSDSGLTICLVKDSSLLVILARLLRIRAFLSCMIAPSSVWWLVASSQSLGFTLALGATVATCCTWCRLASSPSTGSSRARSCRRSLWICFRWRKSRTISWKKLMF